MILDATIKNNKSEWMCYPLEKQGVIVRFIIEQEEVGMYHDAIYHYMTNDGQPDGYLACWPFAKTATFQIELDTLEEAKKYIRQYVNNFINDMEDTTKDTFWKEQYFIKTKHKTFPKLKIDVLHTSEDGEFDYYA